VSVFIFLEVRPEEIDTMMSQFAQDIINGKPKWVEMVRQQSLLEGEARGEARGKTRGEAKLLLRMLPRRFEPLPREISERVYGAAPNTIELWADRVLDAKSLDEVFTD